MADNVQPGIDPVTGLYTEGRFKGFSPADVAAYAETLETGVRTPGVNTPPSGAPNAPPHPPTPPPTELTPEQKLAAAAAQRTSGVDAAIYARLVEDDEAAFRATVEDYDKYKPEIDKLKKNMDPRALMVRGAHSELYAFVKLKDPTIREAFFKTRTEEPPTPGTGESPTPTPEPLRIPVQAHTRQPPTPKAAPPALPPTPGSRQQPPTPPTREPKLVANDKILKFCRATGQDVKQYLLRLEDQGKTQADVDALATTSNEHTARSVYGRTTARTRTP